MMKKILKVFLTILFCIFLTCGKKAPTNPQNIQITNFSNNENIDSSQTWKSNEIHIVKKIISINNAVLTIEPGAVIKFEKDAGMRVNSNAALFAVGSEKVIQFTSDNKSKGFWKYIYFTENVLVDSCKLINCSIEFGGGDNNYPGAVICDNTHLEIQGCNISHTIYSGVLLKGNCRGIEFYNNSISFCDATPIQTSATNIPYIGINSYRDNQINFIDIIDNEINYNDTWYKQPIPFLLNKGLSIKNATLKLFSGVELYFAQNQSLNVSNEGSIKADGSIANIKFAGLDSNYWQGVIFESSANSTSSSLQNCTFSRGGSDKKFPANIVIKNSAPEISNCLIENSLGYGVYVLGAFAPSSFVNNQFVNNLLGAISISANAVSSLHSQNFGSDETNFILVRGGSNEGDIIMDGIWKNLNVPYKIDNSVQIISSVLTIDPGVQIIMSESSAIKVLNQAGFIADGSSGKITIAGAQPVSGFWNNIYFAPDVKIADCRLINCQIKHGGADITQPGMIYCQQCAPLIRNCFIEYSGTWGIYVTGNLTIRDLNTNMFYNNVLGDFHSAP